MERERQKDRGEGWKEGRKNSFPRPPCLAFSSRVCFQGFLKFRRFLTVLHHVGWVRFDSWKRLCLVSHGWQRGWAARCLVDLMEISILSHIRDVQLLRAVNHDHTHTSAAIHREAFLCHTYEAFRLIIGLFSEDNSLPRGYDESVSAWMNKWIFSFCSFTGHTQDYSDTLTNKKKKQIFSYVNPAQHKNIIQIYSKHKSPTNNTLGDKQH